MLAHLIESIRWDQLMVPVLVLLVVAVLYFISLRPLQRDLIRDTALSSEAQPLLSISKGASYLSTLLLTGAMDGKIDEGAVSQHLTKLREIAPLIENYPEAKDSLMNFLEIAATLISEYSTRAPQARIAHSLANMGVAYQNLEGAIAKLQFEIEAKKPWQFTPSGPTKANRLGLAISSFGVIGTIVFILTTTLLLKSGLTSASITAILALSALFTIPWYFTARRRSVEPTETERILATAWEWFRRLLGLSAGALMIIVAGYTALSGPATGEILDHWLGAGGLFFLGLFLIYFGFIGAYTSPPSINWREDMEFHRKNKRRYHWWF